MTTPTDDLKGAFGRCDNVKKLPSRQVTQIIIEIPIEHHRAAVNLLDGHDVWVELVPKEISDIGRYCVIDGEPLMPNREIATKPAPVVKPFGKQAAELYKSGFWYVPAVLQVVGSDAEYRAWIQQQPCIVCNGGDWVEHLGELRCEAAHVKRPSNSGMGHKPEYSCVPLCNGHHVNFQHAHGLPALYAESLRFRKKEEPDGVTPAVAREWFDKSRDALLVKWAATTAATKFFNQPSTGIIPPTQFAKWANDNGIHEYLPEPYKSVTKDAASV